MQEDVDPLWVAVEPSPGPSWLLDAVRSAGAETAPVTQASALIWRGGRADALGELLRHGPNITWVQLPSAGVERYAALLDDRHTWTCAKVIYGRQVAEHALA